VSQFQGVKKYVYRIKMMSGWYKRLFYHKTVAALRKEKNKSFSSPESLTTNPPIKMTGQKNIEQRNMTKKLKHLYAEQK